MGCAHGLPLPRYGWCISPQNPNRCLENHVTPSRRPHGGRKEVRVKGHKRNLSAAFSFSLSDDPIADDHCSSFNSADLISLHDWSAVDPASFAGLVNVNVASEEELMTLSGVNRATAHAIVEYRRKIGGFRGVGDLALVSGVGAARLQVIRPEVWAGPLSPSEGAGAISGARPISGAGPISGTIRAGRAGGDGRAMGGRAGDGFAILGYVNGNAYRCCKGYVIGGDNISHESPISDATVDAVYAMDSAARCGCRPRPGATNVRESATRDDVTQRTFFDDVTQRTFFADVTVERTLTADNSMTCKKAAEIRQTDCTVLPSYSFDNRSRILTFARTASNDGSRIHLPHSNVTSVPAGIASRAKDYSASDASAQMYSGEGSRPVSVRGGTMTRSSSSSSSGIDVSGDTINSGASLRTRAG